MFDLTGCQTAKSGRNFVGGAKGRSDVPILRGLMSTLRFAHPTKSAVRIRL